MDREGKKEKQIEEIEESVKERGSKKVREKNKRRENKRLLCILAAKYILCGKKSRNLISIK